MALNDKQQGRLQKLKARRQSGDLGRRGQKKLDRLKAIRGGDKPGLIGKPGGGGGAAATNPNTTFDSTEEGAESVGADIFGAAGNKLPSVVDAAFGFTTDGLPAAPGTQDLGAERDRIEASLYGNYTKDFEVDKARELDALEQRMAERGIPVGSGDAWDNEMNRFNEGWNDRYDDARSRAVETGGQEWERAFGIGRLGRADALGERLLESDHPLQALGGLLGLGADLGNLGLGHAGLTSAGKIAAKDRKSREKIAREAAAAGGGAPSGGAPPVLAPPLPPPPGVI